ncbi:choice-of-anchor M domain-containing protein [Actinobaculum suis]|uniref:choice-of-anchor M domain-containing protein n=1 Tax=Actinobaculum suis TaxID=1657 RepID=UPI0009E60B6E|nr:choice-of-anchor M domain-containing protein [Actinobaculum suis]
MKRSRFTRGIRTIRAGGATLCAALCAALFALTASPVALADEEQSTNADPALTQVLEADEEVAPLGTPAELDEHHADLGPRLIDGKWTLMVRDDSQATPVWRHLEDVVFRVHDAGKMTVPDTSDYAFVNATGEAYIIPQQEVPGVLWLGWSTQDPEVVNTVNGQVKLIYGGMEGPGGFNLFVQAGNFAGPTELWNSAQEISQPMNVDLNTHTHANWVFAQPGVHLMRVTAAATLTDGTAVEDTQILRFAVGDQVTTEETRQATWPGTAANLPSAEEAKAGATSGNSAAVSTPATNSGGNSTAGIIAVCAVVIALVALAVLIVFARRRKAAQLAALAGQAKEKARAAGSEAAAATTGASSRTSGSPATDSPATDSPANGSPAPHSPSTEG